MVDEAIECRDLTKVLGRRRVVDAVSLNVRRGEVFGFLGPNGAGKTTTIRLLLGLSRPARGEVRLLGSTRPHREEILSRVGSIVEEPYFYPWMSGRRNLSVILQGLTSRSGIAAALDEMGLGDVGTLKVRKYSQGMRQRLALAVAISGEPEALILDEPSTALDPAGIRDFRQLLRRLADNGCAIFLSSHQLSEVERGCDRVAVLSRGRIVAEGTVEALGGDEASVEVVIPHDQDARAAEVLQRLEVSSDGEGHLIVKGASGQAVSHALAQAGIFPESVTKRTSTLEETFLTLTEEEGTRAVDES